MEENKNMENPVLDAMRMFGRAERIFHHWREK